MSGIIGVYSPKNDDITDSLVYGLLASQGRGENGCGVTVVKHGFRTKKRHDNVGSLFTERSNEWEKSFYEFLSDDVRPFAGIGHTLYEKGSGLQPTERENNIYHISLAMDGAFLGYSNPNDAVLADIFFKGLNETGNVVDASHMLMKELDDVGFYNAVVLVQSRNSTKLVAFKDPRGGKPLSLGIKDDKYVFASETQGLDGAKAKFIEDIYPGSVHVIDGDGHRSYKLIEKPHAHCIFDWIYFASPNSIVRGRNVRSVREELGRMLIRRYEYLPDFFCASPDSGRGCGGGCSKESGISLEEYITKNPGAPRTFQIEDPVARRLATLSKFNVNPMVRDKRVGITEDSIVRGTVIKIGTADKVKERGAKEASVFVSFAPMPFRCYRADDKETVAAEGLSGKPVEDVGKIVAERIGVDKVFYNDIKDVIKACGGHGDLCTACATGDYFYVRPQLLRFPV